MAKKYVGILEPSPWRMHRGRNRANDYMTKTLVQKFLTIYVFCDIINVLYRMIL